jgi:prevent-host-death family protein
MPAGVPNKLMPPTTIGVLRPVYAILGRIDGSITMGVQGPMTQTMKISDVKNHLSALVNRIYRKETRILVEKSGIPVAALVSVDDLARLNQLDRDWDERWQAMERMSLAFADVPVDELEARINEIIAADRAQEDAERQSA